MAHSLSRILIVDDDEAICELLSEGLALEGYTCDIASNGDEALTKLHKQRFDVALLDLNLPDIPGIDLLSEFRASAKEIEIIIITALRDVETAVQAMKLGAYDYVVKPFAVGRISNLICRISEARERPVSVALTIPTTGKFDKNVGGWGLNAINAIARGVEDQVDYFDFHSKIVTEKTALAARQLGLPAEDIEEWVSEYARLRHTRIEYARRLLPKSLPQQSEVTK